MWGFKFTFNLCMCHYTLPNFYTAKIFGLVYRSTWQISCCKGYTGIRSRVTCLEIFWWLRADVSGHYPITLMIYVNLEMFIFNKKSNVYVSFSPQITRYIIHFFKHKKGQLSLCSKKKVWKRIILILWIWIILRLFFPVFSNPLARIQCKPYRLNKHILEKSKHNFVLLNFIITIAKTVLTHSCSPIGYFAINSLFI